MTGEPTEPGINLNSAPGQSTEVPFPMGWATDTTSTAVTSDSIYRLVRDVKQWNQWADRMVNGGLEQKIMRTKKEEARLAARTPLEKGFDRLPPVLQRFILAQAYSAIKKGMDDGYFDEFDTSEPGALVDETK